VLFVALTMQPSITRPAVPLAMTVIDPAAALTCVTLTKKVE
jgi:hypothetical protein